MHRGRIVALACAMLLAVSDQASKQMVMVWLDFGERTPVTPFFNLTFHFNRGAAFGIFAAYPWQAAALLVIGVLAIAALLFMIWRGDQDRWSLAGVSALLGGAIGNVMDRARHGAVVDWLDLHVAGWHWPAFNLADVWLLAGVGGVLLGGTLAPAPERRIA